MDLLLREISSQQGVAVFQDTELAADVITVGSAPAQLIQLRGEAIKHSHAIIKLMAGKLVIQGIEKSTFLVNGAEQKKCELAIGDIVLFNTHKLQVIEPPAGFDAALELDLDDDLQSQSLETAYVTDLSGTVLSKRVPAYWFSLIVVLLALAWPISSHFLRDSPVNMDGVATFNSSNHGDQLWSSGPLLPAHQLAIGDDCSVCHKKPFEKVQNESCVSCHQSTANHSDGEVLAMHGGGDTQGLFDNHKNLGAGECQSCHKEHNEPAAIIVSADKLCVDCHQQALGGSGDDVGTPVVTGFSGAAHPAFKLNYVLPTMVKMGTGLSVEWDSQLLEKSAGQKDLSNLKFPHDIHLNGEKVQMADTGDAMLCSSCHALKADGEHFEPLTMEKHCSSCHDLSFAAEQPDRQLPHGQPELIVQTIEEHFVRVYTDPQYQAKGSERRRLPGKSRQGSACTDTPFNCGMQRATAEAAIQFTQRGCVTCHEVTDNQSEDLYARWLVLPVNINPDWHKRASFDHASHLTQSGQTANQVCSSCHEAELSSTSTDVLIPDIENCLTCHGDVSVDEKIQVNCISCHAYHPKDGLIL